MAEYPALPLFTDAFIADTVHLNAAQTGAYLMLLMVAWRTKDCTLPDDDVLLARYARMDNRAWLNNKAVILSFWHKNDEGRLFQKRLVDERIYVDAKRDQAQQAGKASALKRKKRHSAGVSTESQRNFNPHTHTHTHNKDTNVSFVKNRFLEFWTIYPNQRKGSKEKAKKAYMVAMQRDTEENIIKGASAYRLSDEVLNGFAKGAAAWLADDRWNNDYSIKPTKGNTNGKSKSELADEAIKRGISRAQSGNISNVAAPELRHIPNLRQITGEP